MAVASSAGEGGGTATWKTYTALSGIQGFSASMPFLIIFLILTLMISTFGGDDALFWFLVLVFVSMAVINADKIRSKLQGVIV